MYRERKNKISRLVSRSVDTKLGRTSIRLEPKFWDELDIIVGLQETTVNKFMVSVAEEFPDRMFTSAVRVCILKLTKARVMNTGKGLVEDMEQLMMRTP